MCDAPLDIFPSLFTGVYQALHCSYHETIELLNLEKVFKIIESNYVIPLCDCSPRDSFAVLFLFLLHDILLLQHVFLHLPVLNLNHSFQTGSLIY